MTAIGFIGLGIMGSRMARRLLGDNDLIVYNRSSAAVDAIVAEGATAAASPSEVASRSSIVITMLPDTPDVEAVVVGADGILDGASPETLVVDMSTISPTIAKDLAERAAAQGVAMLDAPVSGGDVAAGAGTLSIMVGGDASALERGRPVLERLGQTIVHVGPSGAGQVVKACNQIVVGATIAAVSEALVLASKAGVSPSLVLDVLSGGLAANKVMEVRRSNFLEGDYRPGFKARLHDKDLAIALGLARDLAVALPSTAAVAQLFQAAKAAGRGEEDHTVLLAVLADMASHPMK